MSYSGLFKTEILNEQRLTPKKKRGIMISLEVSLFLRKFGSLCLNFVGNPDTLSKILSKFPVTPASLCMMHAYATSANLAVHSESS